MARGWDRDHIPIEVPVSLRAEPSLDEQLVELVNAPPQLIPFVYQPAPRPSRSRSTSPPEGVVPPPGHGAIGGQPAGQPGAPAQGSTVVQLPPFDALTAILREHRLAQLATVDQQRESMRYMSGLSDWLARDVQDRKAELRAVSVRVDHLREDLGRLSVGAGPGVPVPPGDVPNVIPVDPSVSGPPPHQTIINTPQIRVSPPGRIVKPGIPVQSSPPGIHPGVTVQLSLQGVSTGPIVIHPPMQGPPVPVSESVYVPSGASSRTSAYDATMRSEHGVRDRRSMEDAPEPPRRYPSSASAMGDDQRSPQHMPSHGGAPMLPANLDDQQRYCGSLGPLGAIAC
ncbi:hypothetical protein OG21DRAFT_1507715 [Imleria badia]|nr:hypothetical protein OG21DRAFT_1507715 [Imleria badia]